MRTSGATEQARFPPLEYLLVVGYFRADVSRPSDLLLEVLEVIASHFQDAVSFDTSVATSICRRVGPTIATEPGWKHNPEMGWQQFDAKNKDVRELIRSSNVLSIDTQLVNALLVQQASRSARFRAFDYVWQVELEAAQHYKNFQSDCTCIVGLSTDLFPDDHKTLPKYRESTAVLNELVRIFLRCGDLYYALCDAAYFREAGAGWCYKASGPSNWSSVRFRIEHELGTGWDESTGVCARNLSGPVSIAASSRSSWWQRGVYFRRSQTQRSSRRLIY